MSRKVIGTMDEIFHILESSLSADDRKRVGNHRRHIKAAGDEKEVVEIVKHAKIISTQDKYNTCCISYKDEMFMVFPARSQAWIQKVAIGEFMEKETAIDLQQEYFQGMGMLAIAKGALKIRRTLSSIDLLDKCLGLPEEENRFDFMDICELFEDYVVLKIDKTMFPVAYEEDVLRFIALLHLAINRSEENVSNLINLALLQSARSISWNVLHYSDANQWEYQFLQIYQCLEYLFIIVVAIDLEDKYEIDEDKAIRIAVDNIFKRSEKENLIMTMHRCSYTYVDEYFSLLKTYPQFNGKNDAVKSDYVADHIYQIRCSIAHLRFKQDDILKSIDHKKEISILIQITLNIFSSLDDKICKYNQAMNAWQPLKIL